VIQHTHIFHKMVVYHTRSLPGTHLDASIEPATLIHDCTSHGPQAMVRRLVRLSPRVAVACKTPATEQESAYRSVGMMMMMMKEKEREGDPPDLH
jgi:hypothetical protein